MFARVTIYVSDLGRSELFYDEVLGKLGMEQWTDFTLARDEHERVTQGLHIGFAAPSREHVDAFWRAGLEADYRDDGEPGPRPEYGADYYGAFLLDPDGNSAEAVHYEGVRTGGIVDHVWIRVADVARAKEFYERVGDQVGFHPDTDTPERVQFTSGNGSFSVVAGRPTRGAHMAFRAGSHARLVDPDGNTVELLA